ncbi:MAG TPA: hypothetical protein VGR27_11910 [Longimicrobiaceae bacterium]|nr:hypothetical protein [Longimicrobiaceae bacterium]
MTDELSEPYLDGIERKRDPESIPQLVAMVRQQQRSLDGLRLSLDVAQRDRQELRSALLAAQEEIRQLRARLAKPHTQDEID